jgi:hypothetical protein
VQRQCPAGWPAPDLCTHHNQSPDARFGSIAALLREGKQQVLPKSLDACRNQLGPALNDSALTAAANQLNDVFEDLELAYAKIDRTAAIKKVTRN